jgi:hypothetical protein
MGIVLILPDIGLQPALVGLLIVVYAGYIVSSLMS